MACCLTATSHYLNQCWLNISVALWHSAENYFPRNAQDIYPWYQFENYWFKTSTTCSRGQWVKACFDLAWDQANYQTPNWTLSIRCLQDGIKYHQDICYVCMPTSVPQLSTYTISTSTFLCSLYVYRYTCACLDDFGKDIAISAPTAKNIVTKLIL